MITHVFLDYDCGFFLDHMEKESVNLVVYVTEMVRPHL